MPSPEVHQKTKEKSGSTQVTQHQITNCPSSLAFLPEDEFVELLWENGDIVMKGQSSRTKNYSLSSCFPSDSPKVQEKDEGDAVIPKIGRYSSLPSVMNDFSLPGPSGQVGLVQDDEMVPWLNYPIHDSLQSDYFGEFFSELTGTNLNSLSRQSNAVLTDSNGQARIDATVPSAFSCGSQEQRNPSEVVGGSEPIRIRSSQSCSAKQGQHLVSDLTPRVSEFLNKDKSNNHQAVPRNLTQLPVSATGVTNSTSVRPPEPGKSRGVVNFSHFLRPAALVKANLQGISTASASFSNVDSLKINEEVSASGSNIIEPSLVVSTNSSRSLVGVQHLPISDPNKVDSKSYRKSPQELISVDQSEATCQEDASRNNNHNSSRGDAPYQSLSFAASVAAHTSESERAFEPVVASSSGCSGNSAGGLPNEPKHAAKRKAVELEELEYQSEDVEDESADVKKPTKSTKRSRTAEVHNLSERRRRDRINEKMRALQELIPNCNKVDKASMLDEAIEYIKTLQLHMQIMSTGSRLCMPPMMLPAGIQHIGTPPMPHFSPLGVGFGMGMSAAFGIGIPGVNHMVPVPSIHGSQFPCPSVPGASNLHGMQVSTPHVFGVPGQHLPFTHHHRPFIPVSGGFSSMESSVPNVSEIATPVSNHDSSLPSCSKDQSQNINLQAMHNKKPDCSHIQASTEETKESSEAGDLVQKNNAASPVNASGS